jgi:hypothetical protein
MGTVFISYRRGDSSGHTGRLFDDLEERFGRAAFFRDIESLELGSDFPAALDRALADCKVVLVMIGPGWLSAESGGARRLDQPADFVRIEVATALARSDVHTIPVLVGGARMPASSELPDPLKRLATRNGIELSDTRWDYDLGRLADGLVRTAGLTELKPRAAEPGPTPPASDLAARANKRASGRGKVGMLGLAGVATLIVLYAIGSGSEEGAAADEAPGTFEHAGLIWQADPEGAVYDWNQAVAHCESVGDGFRLPTIDELGTLVDASNPSAAVRELLGRVHGGSHPNLIWSSEEDGPEARIALDFATGELDSRPIGFNKRIGTLCARSPQ